MRLPVLTPGSLCPWTATRNLCHIRSRRVYTGNPLPTQDALMLSEIHSELAAGHTISTVTVSLGANDLFLALANSTPFDQALATV